MDYQFLNLTAADLESHHLCCALSGQKHQEGVQQKKAFLRSGFESGLVFRKLDVRGKVFVEFAPIEAAWKPLVGSNHLVIHCFWVSGRYQGTGLGGQLWDYCREQSESTDGVLAISGHQPYLTPTRFYRHHGFEIIDRSRSGYELVRLGSSSPTDLPQFTDLARSERLPLDDGLHFEYAFQCPFVPDCLREMSRVGREFGLNVTSRHLKTAREAQSCASPFGTFGAFLEGRLITHELMSPNKFKGLLQREMGR